MEIFTSPYLIPKPTELTPSPLSVSSKLLLIELKLVNNLNTLIYKEPVEFIYNPIDYAYDIHSKFVHKYCQTTKKVLFLGMNPGPWGMSQTGVPFGEVSVVREWLDLSGSVNHPPNEHPDRVVSGLACRRSEVSGRRFWGLFQDICVNPQTFFRHCFVYNHCPFAFMTKTGKNVTPTEMKASQRKELIQFCDSALLDVIRLLEVNVVIGIGKFAEKRAIEACKSSEHVQVYFLPHPSPRNFHIKDWKAVAKSRLEELNLMNYFV